MKTSSLSTYEVANGPTVSWGAIFAGAFFAFIVNLTLMSFGSAVGFSALDPNSPDAMGRGALIGIGVFTVAVAIISLFAGGYVSARLAGFHTRTVAGLHGLSAWAVVSTITAIMIAIGIGKVTGAALTAVGDTVKGATVAGVAATAGTGAGMNLNDVISEVRQLLKDTGKPALNPDNISREVSALAQKAARAQADLGGDAGAQVAQQQGQEIANNVDRDAIANVLSKRMNITKDQASSLIGQSEQQANEAIASLQAKAQEAKEKAAEASTKVAAAASWLTFFSLLVGAVSAYFGGVVGGRITEDDVVGLTTVRETVAS